MDYRIDNGLVVTDTDSGIPQCVGYIFKFQGHGDYDPSGKITVGDLELTTEQIETHNRLLGEMELELARKTGKLLAYLTEKTIRDDPKFGKSIEYHVTNFSGSLDIKVSYVRHGRHNIGRTRQDVWFKLPRDKYVWHGVQIGQCNQVLRCKRTKATS